MPHQDGFGNNGTETTGLTEPDDGDDGMEKKCENVAHAPDGIKLKKLKNSGRLRNSPTTGSYGVATTAFAFSAMLVSFLYVRGADTFLRRAAVALFMSGAMAFSVSASTLGQLSSMVVNITKLRP